MISPTYLTRPPHGQIFAEAAIFGAVGIGNCDKLFPSMLYPTTCAKTEAEALEHVRRLEADPAEWTAASEHAQAVLMDTFDLKPLRDDLDTIVRGLDCRVRTSDLPQDSYDDPALASVSQECAKAFITGKSDR